MNINLHKVVLGDLKNLLNNITNESFSRKNESLFGASIGEHFRHIIEFYLCVLDNETQDIINYDLRKSDHVLETKTKEGVVVINQVLAKLEQIESYHDTPILIETCINKNQTNERIASSFFRELIYCMDHCIHHQSLIKIGLLEQRLTHIVDTNFGVAFSTQQYRSQCVS